MIRVYSPRAMDNRELKAHEAVTDYALTGKCPDGVSPEVMELLAKIVGLS